MYFLKRSPKVTHVNFQHRSEVFFFLLEFLEWGQNLFSFLLWTETHRSEWLNISLSAQGFCLMRPLKALFTFASPLCADARAVRDGSQGTPFCAQRGGSLWTNKKTSQTAFQSTGPVRSTLPHKTPTDTSTRNLTPLIVSTWKIHLPDEVFFSPFNCHFLLSCVHLAVSTLTDWKSQIINCPCRYFTPLQEHVCCLKWCINSLW